MNHDFQVPWQQSWPDFYKIPHSYNCLIKHSKRCPSPPLFIFPTSHQLRVLSHIHSVGPTKNKPPLTMNAMIDISCWLGQEISNFPSALSRKLLAQLYSMGQNSLRHGNNFLHAARSSRKGPCVCLAKCSALGMPGYLSYAPDPVAHVFSTKPTQAGHRQLTHRRSSVAVPPTKENIRIFSIYVMSLLRKQILWESNYLTLHDLFLVHLFALNETFQVLCKEGSFRPCPHTNSK